MKTSYFKLFGACAFSVSLLISACHSGSKESTELADSTNQSQIKATDSANKADIDSSKSNNTVNTALKEDASKFLVSSYESGMYEIQISQLAATNSLIAGVKKLASDLVVAHTAINAKMSAIAASANFVLPVSLNSNHQKSLEELSKLTGTGFDKKYVSVIIAGHEKSISNYKDAFKNLTDSKTKTFAGETIPEIEGHLSMAKKVKNELK